MTKKNKPYLGPTVPYDNFAMFFVNEFHGDSKQIYRLGASPCDKD